MVRRVGEGYELIAGERRLRAAQAADWRQVPVQIRDVDDRQMAELAIVENVQRKDLNAIEKAESFQRYIDQYQCTQEELAGRVNVDRSTVANLIRLLELPPDVKQMVQRRRHLAGPRPGAVAAWATNRNKSNSPHESTGRLDRVRATEQGGAGSHPLDGRRSACESSTPTAIPARWRKPRNEQIASLEQELRTSLGTKVDLSQTAKGRGKITIHFKSHEEFARLRLAAHRGKHAAAAIRLNRNRTLHLPLGSKGSLPIRPIAVTMHRLPGGNADGA